VDSNNPPVSLLFGVHAHQPVGNFQEVISDAHLRCYSRFIYTLADYPDFRFSVHFSGWLLDELEARWPEDMAQLAKMTRRGQVEWFSSGDCEPVLTAIPERDRLSQLHTLNDKIHKRYGQSPRGAWLTERVWEPSVVQALAGAGLRYVTLDDYHLFCAGVKADQLDGFYTTEDAGRTLDIFPISEDARYRIPFAPAHETIAWLEDAARNGQQAVVYFDDIEKFGIWPETYRWVYEEGWLRQFTEGVLASPLISPCHYQDFHSRRQTRGVVYLPTVSYSEMSEWTLPPDAAQTYRQLVDDSKRDNRFDRDKPFLRGGVWRNFMMRYPEANWMHKRMLQVSERFAALPKAEQTETMQTCLHRSQANDAYWHGLFGGLYLPHLRRAIWNHLLQLEQLLNQKTPPQASRAASRTAHVTDIDLDGHAEICLIDTVKQYERPSLSSLLAIIRADCDAALVELSSLTLYHNFGDTLRRHPESYHEQAAAGESEVTAQHEGGIASAHERVSFKSTICPEDLTPDTRPRASFLDSLIYPDGVSVPLSCYQPVSHTNSGTDAIFECQTGETRLRKRYQVNNDQLTVDYARSRAHMEELEAEQLVVQINLAMPSCDGYLGRYRLSGGEVVGGFGETLKLAHTSALTLEDGVLGGLLRIDCSQQVEWLARPHFTVSQSEAGFEKIMQAVEINLTWHLITSDSLCIGVTIDQHTPEDL